MSIPTEITRIQGLVTRLVTKLRSLGLLDSNTHDFEDAVTACENLGSNLENKTLTLGEDVPTPQVTPSSGYSGMSQLSFPINGNQINPAFIVEGNTIVGVAGTAIINNLKMRRASFTVNIDNSNTFTITAENCYQNTNPPTGWVHLSYMPIFNELMMFKRSGAFSSNKRTCLTVFHNIVNGYGEWTAVDSSAAFTHIGDPSHPNLVEYTYSADGKSLTVRLASQLDVFNGNYVVYIYF